MDIDQAHKLRKWLDIGVQSYRNLTFIPFSRAALWLLLGLSSWPIHLL